MIYQFGQFELDTAKLELRSHHHLLSIAPKTFSLLVFLVENNERLVSKTELMENFWSRNSSEAALQKSVSLLRQVLQDDDPDYPIIKTVHGRGFRFVPRLTTISDQVQEDQNTPPRHIMEERQCAILCVEFLPHGSVIGDSSEIDAFLKTARQKVDDDDGVLLRTTINGFAVRFGQEVGLEDSARRAVSCAWSLTQSRAAHVLRSSGTAFSIAIDLGPIAFTEEAEAEAWVRPSALEIRAAQLATAAPENTIALSNAALKQLRDEVSIEKQDWGNELCAPPAFATGVPVQFAGSITPFVGRTAEFAYLDGCLKQAMSGPFQGVVLSGPPGMGKTRLVREFSDQRGGEGLRQIKIQCAPRRRNSALAALQALNTALDVNASDDLEQDELERALLCILRGETPSRDVDLESLSGRHLTQRLSALIQKQLAHAAQTDAWLIVIEDIHWMDPTSANVLRALANAGGVSRVFLLMTARPEAETSVLETVLNLSPLGIDESIRLIRDMPGTRTLSDDQARELSARASGNPFFLEELVFAADQRAGDDQNLPTTVRTVIEARIVALEPRLRSLLYVIAVAGEEADALALSHLARTANLEEDLDHLLQRGFLFSVGRMYSFRHALLSDTVYAMIAEHERRLLHAECLEFLEQSGRDIRDETRALHHQEAGNKDQAIKYWSQASFAASHRSARSEAIHFAQAGLALIDTNNADHVEPELRLRVVLATALMAASGYGHSQVGDELRRAFELSQQVQSPKLTVRVVLGLWVHTWVCGQLDTALTHAKTLLKMAALAGDDALSLHAHSGAGAVLTHLGRLSEAQTHLEQGLKCAQSAAAASITNQNAAVTCAAYAAWVAGMRGRRETVAHTIQISDDLSRLRDNPFARAIHFALCSEAHMFLGDVNATLDFANQAVSISQDHGFPFWLGTGLVMQGWALGQNGDADVALEMIDNGIDVFQQTGAGVQYTNWYGLKSEICLKANQQEDALAFGEKALGLADKTGDTWFAPRVHGILARAVEQFGNEATATHHSACAQRLMSERELSQTFVASSES